MAIQEELLEVDLSDEKDKAQPGFMLDIEDQKAMVLGQLPQTIVFREQQLRDGFRDCVKRQIEDPIEHLD